MVNSITNDICAIDPGYGGGIAYSINSKIYSRDMKSTYQEIFLDLCDIVNQSPNILFLIENVGQYRSGNSGTAAAKFARHVGNIEMGIFALNREMRYVAPNSWMSLLPIDLPKQVKGKPKIKNIKQIRKNMIKKFAKEFVNSCDIKVTLKNSDALGMLWVGLNCPNLTYITG